MLVYFPIEIGNSREVTIAEIPENLDNVRKVTNDNYFEIYLQRKVRGFPCVVFTGVMSLGEGQTFVAEIFYLDVSGSLTSNKFKKRIQLYID